MLLTLVAKENDANNRLSLTTENRLSLESPYSFKKNTKYTNHPKLFHNKMTCIQKILKKKKASGHLDHIIKNRNSEQSKFNLCMVDTQEVRESSYFNYDYIFNNCNSPLKIVRRSLEAKISCQGMPCSSAGEKKSIYSSTKRLQKRKIFERHTTEPPEQQKFKMIGVNNPLVDTTNKSSINLSPWHE